MALDENDNTPLRKWQARIDHHRTVNWLREKILEVLIETGHPLSFDETCQLVEPGPELPLMRGVYRLLVRDGEVDRQEHGDLIYYLPNPRGDGVSRLEKIPQKLGRPSVAGAEAVFDILQQGRSLTKSQIVRESGRSRATVTRALRYLMKHKAIRNLSPGYVIVPDVVIPDFTEPGKDGRQRWTPGNQF